MNTQTELAMLKLRQSLDSYLGREIEEKEFSGLIAGNSSEVKCLTNLGNQSNGPLKEARLAIVGLLAKQLQNTNSSVNFPDDDEQGGNVSIPFIIRDTQRGVDECLTEEDSLKLRAISLYSLVEKGSKIGDAVADFRNQFLGGVPLPLQHFNKALWEDENRIARLAGAGDTSLSGWVETNGYFKDFIGSQLPKVPPKSMFSAAIPLAERIRDGYKWTRNEAILFLFTGKLPDQMRPMKVDINRSVKDFNWDSLYYHSNYHPETWRIEVAPWLSPKKVEQAMRIFQSTPYFPPRVPSTPADSSNDISSDEPPQIQYRPKIIRQFSKLRLTIFIFVLEEMDRRNKRENLSPEEWQEIHNDWQADPYKSQKYAPLWTDEPDPWQDRAETLHLARFKKAYTDVKSNLFPDAAEAPAPAKPRGGKRPGAGRPRKS